MSELIAVSIHRATGISGVTTAGANIAALDLPGIRVLPLIVGPASQVGTAASAANLVPDILSGWHVASWPDDSSPLDAMLIIRNALISLGARIVLPHDSVLLRRGRLARSRGSRRGALRDVAPQQRMRWRRCSTQRLSTCRLMGRRIDTTYLTAARALRRSIGPAGGLIFTSAHRSLRAAAGMGSEYPDVTTSVCWQVRTSP